MLIFEACVVDFDGLNGWQLAWAEERVAVEALVVHHELVSEAALVGSASVVAGSHDLLVVDVVGVCAQTTVSQKVDALI